MMKTTSLLILFALALSGVGLPSAQAAIAVIDLGPATLSATNGVEATTVEGSDLEIQYVQIGNDREGRLDWSGFPVELTGSGSTLTTFTSGSVIDSNTSWISQDTLFSYDDGTTSFDANLLSPSGSSQTLGIKLTDFSSNTYYGWLEVTDIAGNGSSFTVSSLVYNDVPDEGILAGEETSSEAPAGSSAVPEPSSALFAILGFGFVIWRLNQNRRQYVPAA